MRACEAISSLGKSALRDHTKYSFLSAIPENLGNVYLKKGMEDAAISEYSAALRFGGERESAYYNLGVAYSRKGMTAEAIDNFNKALRINPNNTAAIKNMEILKAEFEGRHKENQYCEVDLSIVCFTPLISIHRIR